jgi:hypothetical protein
MPLGQMPLGQMPLGQMPLGQMPLGQMPLGQMPLSQMPVDQMVLDPSLFCLCDLDRRSAFPFRQPRRSCRSTTASPPAGTPAPSS